MNWKFWKRPTVAFVFASAFCFVIGTDAFAAPNQAAEKYDLTTSAHFDTTLATAPGDTLRFGFVADNAVVCVPATSSATVLWIGQGNGTVNGTAGPKLVSNSGGIFGNTRKGMLRFTSTVFTPPASSCYTYYGAPICAGVVVGGTWTGTVVVIADRAGK